MNMYEQKETIIQEMEAVKNKKVEMLEMESIVRMMNIFFKNLKKNFF